MLLDFEPFAEAFIPVKHLSFALEHVNVKSAVCMTILQANLSYVGIM